jgi:hypothetical protein
MTLNPGVQGEEDERILGVTAELCETLRVSFRPLGVTWMATLGHASHLPSDQSGFITKGTKKGRLVLPLAVKGMLDVGEWRPLIASSLFFQFRPEIRRTWRVLSLLLQATFIIAFLAGPFVFVTFLILESNRAWGFEIYATALVVFVIAVYFLSRLSFRFFNLHVLAGLRLKADRLASQVVGTEQFIRTLQKIEAMRIEDIEERKAERRSIWKRRGVSPWPTIIQRLNNLQSLPIGPSNYPSS